MSWVDSLDRRDLSDYTRGDPAAAYRRTAVRDTEWVDIRSEAIEPVVQLSSLEAVERHYLDQVHHLDGRPRRQRGVAALVHRQPCAELPPPSCAPSTPFGFL